MTKYSSDYKRAGREIHHDKPRKKRVKQYSKNGFEIFGDRPSREKQYVIPYETYRG
ncbi:MAG: hypothetical protein RR588_02055 [Solibacillus sp.]